MAKRSRQPDKARNKREQSLRAAAAAETARIQRANGWRRPEGRTTRFEAWMCFNCGHLCDAASSILEDATPAEGDVSACINCAEPSILRDGVWMPARAEDIANLTPEVRRELLTHQWAIEEMHKVKGKPEGRRSGRV